MAAAERLIRDQPAADSGEQADQYLGMQGNPLRFIRRLVIEICVKLALVVVRQNRVLVLFAHAGRSLCGMQSFDFV